MFCKYCGSLIDKDSSFCNHCGKNQNENVPKSSKTSDTKLSLQKYKSKKKALFFVLGGLLLLLIIWLTASLLNRKQIADITIDKVSLELAEATKNYDQLYDFHEGLAKVCKNDKYGFIDKLGHEIIPCIYDEANDFALGVSIVKKGEKTGAINKYGKIVIPCKYDNINSFGKDSLAVAFLNEKSGFIDLKGNIVIPFNYEYCESFSDGLAAVRQNGLYGFINNLKSATKLFSVLLASKRPLITELADKLRLKYPLLPTISPCPTMRLEAIRSIIPISCRRYPKSV